METELITDIPTIGRMASRSENSDYAFRSRIRGSSMSDAKIDAIVQETTDEVWANIDCTTCANCCKTLEIPVRPSDIQRLSAFLNMTNAEFAAAYLKTDSENQQLLKGSPCVFLGEDNKCTVYDNRPKVCREYPFLHKRDFRSRTFNMIDNTSVCPIVFNVWRRLKRVIR